MWPDALVRMQQHLLKAAIHTHTLVLGKILQKGSEAFLQSYRQIDSLNLDRRASVEQVMSEDQVIPIQIPHRVIADAVRSVIDHLRDFDTIGAMEFVQLVGVADNEIHGATLRAGRGGAFLQEDLDFAKVHAGECRRFTPAERMLKAQLLGVVFRGGCNVNNR